MYYKRKKIIILICAGSILLNTFAFAQKEVNDKQLEKTLTAQKAGEQDLKKYEKAVEKDPDSDVANYNLGTAYYRKGEYEKSIESFMKSLNTEDNEIEAKATYNIANSKYKIGNLKAGNDLNSAIKDYRDSLDYYKRAMDLDESDRDAKYNHELVEKKLKILLDKMKNQQQQQDRNKDQEKNGNKENKEGQGKQDKQQKEDGKQQNQQKEQAGLKKDKEQAGADQKQQQKKNTQSSGKEKKPSEKMSPEEARMLLEAYGQEEARDKVKRKMQGSYGEVLKDW